MAFNPYSPEGLVKSPESVVENQERKAWEELADFCERAGNRLEPVDHGYQDCQQLELNPAMLAGLSENDSEAVKLSFKSLQEFVASEMFTDQYHKDHQARILWEKNNLAELDPELYERYKDNRLRGNATSAQSFIEDLAETIAQPEINKKLKNIVVALPLELFKENKDDGTTDYSRLSDEAKISTVNLITAAAKLALRLLSQSPENPTI
jgi:hypothetical protein